MTTSLTLSKALDTCISRADIRAVDSSVQINYSCWKTKQSIEHLTPLLKPRKNLELCFRYTCVSFWTLKDSNVKRVHSEDFV